MFLQIKFWVIKLFSKQEKTRKKQILYSVCFSCNVPRSYPPDWTVSRGKDLLWSVGNVNTLSDLKLYPDVPHVNISKYRPRLRVVSLNTPTYIMCVHKRAHTHTSQAHQMLLMALTFAHGLLGGFVPDLWPLNALGGSEHSLFGFQNTSSVSEILSLWRPPPW